MESPNNKIHAPNIKGASILFATGILGSLGLKAFNIISEPSFVFLFCVFLLVSVFIAIRHEVAEFSFRDLSLKMKAIDSIVANQTEPEPNTISFKGRGFATKLESIAIDEEAKIVIKAVNHPLYTWRYFDSIVTDSGLSVEAAKDKLNWAIISNLVVEYDGIGGKVYSLSSKGRSILNNIDNQT